VIALQSRTTRRRCGVDMRELVERAGDLFIDATERRHHLGDALTGEILEIASFEDLDHAIPDVVGEFLRDVALERGRHLFAA